MTRSKKYWEKRFEAIEAASNASGLKSYKEIEETFYKAQREIQADIDSWYYRIAKNNKVSMAEARKLLSKRELEEFRWNVEEYIKYGQANAFNQEWMKELENASAKFHISKLESLKIQTQQAMEKAFGNELDVIDKVAKEAYTESYYHSIYEIQKGFGIGWDIASINESQLEKFIAKPWAPDGQNFSSRIWNHKTLMINDLHKELVRTCLLGEPPDRAINRLSTYVDDKFKNAKSRAAALVQTEQAFFYSAAQKESFNSLDVEQFEIVATLDSHTSPICRELDGKVFDMKDYAPGATAPPFHVRCRSVTVPYFDDEWAIGDSRAARGADGKTYYIPGDIKYKEWEETFVKGGDKSAFEKVTLRNGINYIRNPKNGKTVLKTNSDSVIIQTEGAGTLVIPNAKIRDYALKEPNKAKVFKSALGYDQSNWEELRDNIIDNVDESKFVKKGDLGHGQRYEFIMNLTGPNEKQANVVTAWIQKAEGKRLVTAYVNDRKEVTQ